jgi:hypothetical protein
LLCRKTKKEDFSLVCLKALANFHDFDWNWLPAGGTAGGILVGINLGFLRSSPGTKKVLYDGLLEK